MLDIHLAIPPNIARKTIDDLKKDFPGIHIRPHQTHVEMDAFFEKDFGKPEHTADLTLTAYPSALTRLVAMDDPGQVFASMPETLPALRPDLADLGVTEANPYYRVVCLVCLVAIAHKDTNPFPQAWGDLCHENIRDAMAIPPEETPAPALYTYFQTRLNGDAGREAARRTNKTLLPLDINQGVDAGDFKAGMLLSAFARTFRHNNARMVWPREGAFALPLLAFLKKDAPREALDILTIIFGRSFQEFLAKDGGFVPVRADVDVFGEVAENHCHIQWMGWQDYTSMKEEYHRQMGVQ
ncbi:MAG: hypothetical protein CSA21_01410 [Deltaproteobacteria bacterium]|nr:MAG: hypothetical protein CSA21_01410 [Deltaproteobacteria bacterium]